MEVGRWEGEVESDVNRREVSVRMKAFTKSGPCAGVGGPKYASVS